MEERGPPAQLLFTDLLISQQLQALTCVGIDVVLLLLQEKGIPLMGESSFLASWVNRRATMMGMCVCFKIVLLFGSEPASSSVRPATQGMFSLPDTFAKQ